MKAPALRAAGACYKPALAWAVLSLLATGRHAGLGPLCRPVVRCSGVPVRARSLDAALRRLRRHLASREGFLNLIADGLDRLAAPSATATSRPAAAHPTAPPRHGPTHRRGPATAAAARPPPAPSPDRPRGALCRARGALAASGVPRVPAQLLGHLVGGGLLARLVAGRPPSPRPADDAAAVVALAVALVPALELLAGIGDAELPYGRPRAPAGDAAAAGRSPARALARDLGRDALRRARRSVLWTAPAPVVAVAFAAFTGAWSRDDDGAPSHLFARRLATLLASALAAAVVAAVLAAQDALARRAACAPGGADVDVLLRRTIRGPPEPSSPGEFLAEDLLVQAILAGDPATMDLVAATDPLGPATTGPAQRAAAPPGPRNRREDELRRHAAAAASFASWVRRRAAAGPGGASLAADLLRLALLESLGGRGGEAAVRRRLALSAAAARPGRPPVAAPVARALCAFAGGTGLALGRAGRPRRADEDSTAPPRGRRRAEERWEFPPGACRALEFALVAAARLVVTNEEATPAKRQEWLSLLLPCVLQAAFELRCGIYDYARSAAGVHGIDVATRDASGKEDEALRSVIAEKYPGLCSVLAACNSSAKMVLTTLMDSGDRSLEDVLLRRQWKDGMQPWLVGMTCKEVPACGSI